MHQAGVVLITHGLGTIGPILERENMVYHTSLVEVKAVAISNTGLAKAILMMLLDDMALGVATDKSQKYVLKARITMVLQYVLKAQISMVQGKLSMALS